MITNQDSNMDDEDHSLIGRMAKSNKKSSTRRSTSHVLLIALIAFLLLLCLMLAAVVVGVSVPLGLRLNCNTCTTESCVQLAATVLANMNTSVDPCEDFYNYSCGGWVDDNIIPPGRGIWGVFNQLDNRNQIRLKKLIEGDMDSDVPAIQLARQLYSACNDLDTITKMGAQPLVDAINDTGGWSLITELEANGMFPQVGLCIIYIYVTMMRTGKTHVCGG